jgi:hypothetical protein
VKIRETENKTTFCANLLATSRETQRKVRMLELYSPRGEYIAKYNEILNQSAGGKLYIHYILIHPKLGYYRLNSIYSVTLIRSASSSDSCLVV